MHYVDAGNKESDKEKEKIRLNRYNLKEQTVELRLPNLGKEITDRLPTITIDPETLDMFFEVGPVDELIEVMSNKLALFIRTEMPKWLKRRKLNAYGWGAIKSILKMNLTQNFRNPFVSKVKEKDLSRLKNGIKEYATGLGYILAEFIRSKGYKCWVRVPFDAWVKILLADDHALMPLHISAINFPIHVSSV